jgi:PPOX class probable FMN-dependent enzyme
MTETEVSLRSIFGNAEGLAVQKSRPGFDKYSRQFLSLSPFLVISTSNKDGKADVSPRGDPPGFVYLVDDQTMLIPDRPGNNRLDTMVNIVENPNVACLFFIPGFEDTLRVAGKAVITSDPELLKHCIVSGKQPKAGILVTVDEVFLHCAKALKRSRLWSDDYKQDRTQMPSIARIILDQVSEAGVDEKVAAEADGSVEENYRKELY